MARQLRISQLMEKLIPILDNDRKHVKVYEMYIATKKNMITGI